MKIFLTILLSIPIFAFSQSAGKSRPITTSFGDGGQLWRGFDSNSHYKRPVYICGKGSGENGTSTSTPGSVYDSARNNTSPFYIYDAIRTAAAGGTPTYSTPIMIEINSIPYPFNPGTTNWYNWIINNVADVDSNRVFLIVLSLTGSYAGNVPAEDSTGLGKRFAGLVAMSPTQTDGASDIIAGLRKEKLASWWIDCNNDDNGISTNHKAQDNLIAYQSVGAFTPAPKFYFPTSSNSISLHAGGWKLLSPPFAGTRNFYVDSSLFTGHTATNVQIPIQSLHEQMFATVKNGVSGGGGNILPVANAGSNQTITLPTSTATLNATGSTDADGTIVTYAWTKTSGPSTYTITTASSNNTTATGLVAGTYVFSVLVTDNSGGTNSASVTITVNAAGNIPPVANAGTTQTLLLGTTPAIISANLSATGSSDADGTIVAYSWILISGTSVPTITTPSASTTTITGLRQGTYVMRVIVTDNLGAYSYADVTVIVKSLGTYMKYPMKRRAY